MKLSIAGSDIEYPVDFSLIDADLDRPFHSSPFTSARDVCNLFLAQGIECFIMGGAVRNWLIGTPARDIDMTVGCPIDTAISIISPLSEAISIKPKAMFGLVYLLGDSGDIDVNSMRSCDDIAGNPDIDAVTFHPRFSLEQDAQCRDFTINAFYLSVPDYRIVNFFPESLDDLESGTIRLVMDQRKLKIDYRTTIRILQFLARGYTPTEYTLAVLKEKLDHDIVTYPKYREWMEFHVPRESPDYAKFRELIFRYAVEPQAVDLLKIWFAQAG
jgi:tRNA nucleotidyltransferase/poly(A) polymerase